MAAGWTELQLDAHHDICCGEAESEPERRKELTDGSSMESEQVRIAAYNTLEHSRIRKTLVAMVFLISMLLYCCCPPK